MKRFAVGVLAFQLTGLCALDCLAAQSDDTPAAPATAPAEARDGEDAASGLDLSGLSSDRFAPSAPDAARLLPGSTFSFGEPVGDGRRTLGAFPRNVARGVIGVFSRDTLAPFVVGSGLALAGHSLDRRVETALAGSCTSCGRTGASAGGPMVVPVVGALFLAGRFAPQGAFRAASYDLAQALAVNAVWTGALKFSLHRQRPDGSDFYSLPSGHTSTAFSLAAVTQRHFGWKAGVPAYLAAAGIGLSRIESNKHYLSDVLAGATIGVIVGRTVTRVNGEPGAKRKTFSLHPATDPRGAGVGLGMSASW